MDQPQRLAARDGWKHWNTGGDGVTFAGISLPGIALPGYTAGILPGIDLLFRQQKAGPFFALDPLTIIMGRKVSRLI